MENKLTRRESRENAFLAAFSATFQPDAPDDVLLAHAEIGELTLDEFSRRLLHDLFEHEADINAAIAPHLKGWAIGRVPRVSLVAIRMALAEMLYGEEKKPGVAINEAVELVKKYGAENDYQFVNGLLGSIARGETPAQGQPLATEPPLAEGESAEPQPEAQPTPQEPC
ncbi:MAG: transcription antitermination factor NusB [Gemmiger sp.]|nr:transcription antitermination factor NusB [Gemmiger sp.]